MPRDPRTRRFAATAGAASAGAPAAAHPSYVSLLARTTRLIDLLPQLHQQALEATGGSCSLLFESNPATGTLQATSGFALDELRSDPWTPGPEEAALVASAFAQQNATLVVDARRQMPDLASRLNVPAALLVPLLQAGERAGLLAVGFVDPPAPDRATDGAEVADAFVTALELFRLRQKEQLQRDLRELLSEFSSSLSTTLNLSAALELFCHGANRLFGADRTSVWLHDRRSRHLDLRASSDPEHIPRDVRVPADDALAPAAVAMRRTRAEILAGPEDVSTCTVTIPLRGTRRALGTIVFDGVRLEAGGELDLLGRADALGREVSNSIENTQLLEHVLGQRRQLENMFDSIAHLIVVADRRGHIVHANQAFARQLNTTREDVLDRQLSACVGPELAEWIEQHAASGVGSDGQDAAVRELVDPVLNGPFIVTLTNLVERDQGRGGIVLVARDLTPQARLEAEREQLRRRLAQSEKLAALGQFVAGIAHELNNPLQGVLGHLELMRATGAVPKELRSEVQTIYREADRAAKIVRNLLVFAGSRRLARRSVSLNAVLQKVLTLREAACRAHDIEVVRHYDDALPRIQSDPLLLHQVFVNMVLNAEHAIAATGRPGRIELTTGVAGGGDRVVATVRDTGVGIPADAMPRIFEPFYTTKEVGKGTGLGLAIAYGIVQEHGGHISAANHADGGAIFTVELPVAGPAGR